MESSERGALSLVRLVAACIILVGVLDGGMYFTQYLMPYAAVSITTSNQHLPPLNILRIIWIQSRSSPAS